MMGMPLHLLRHGAPETPGLLLGRTDSVPTRAGIDACLAQAEGLEIEMIVTSDLQRARQAATAIGERAGLPVWVDPRWRELDFGIWDRHRPGPDHPAPPGSEGWTALLGRIADAVEDLPRVPTLVLTHGGAMRAALAHLCGFSVQQSWSFGLPYAALLSLERWTGEPPLARITGLRP